MTKNNFSQKLIAILLATILGVYIIYMFQVQAADLRVLAARTNGQDISITRIETKLDTIIEILKENE